MEASFPASIRSNTLFHALALNGTSLLILDSEQVVTWASYAAYELFDRDSERDLVGSKWADLIQIDGESVWNSIFEKEYEAQGYLKTDGYCDAGKRGRIAIDVVMYPNQQSGERIVLIRDITASMEYEQKLEVEKRNAEILNQALEREIQKANELAVMAERANIAKSVFLTSMSHEFRTPLNGVLGYAQILSSDEKLSDSNRKAAATIERCGQHLLSIINDVLDLSKIEAGKVEVAKEPLNLKTLITDVIDVFKVRASSKGLGLFCEYLGQSKDLEWIVGDSKLIRQILINLIGNAVKFTDHGSVTLKLEVSGFVEEDPFSMNLRLSVIDTGPGIEKKFIERVFEEFYQTEAFSGHKGGTGLGLAISRKLADAMGGKLLVESEIGAGSCFYFEFPTHKIEQKSDQEELLSEIRNMKIACEDTAFLQIFKDELDHGVMENVIKSLGVCDENCYRIQESIKEINPALHPIWIVGVSIASLMQDNAQELVEWAGHSVGKVVVLLYVDRSQSKCQSFLDALRGVNPTMIPVEIPIQISKLKEQLLKHVPELFVLERQDEHVDTSIITNLVIGNLSESVPDTDTMRSLLKEAHMGDMRRLIQKLELWTSQNSSSLFESRIRQFVDAFKIDQLCKYLEETLYNQTK